MTRYIKLLTALCAFGCGSGAMAAPDHPEYGQWTGYGPGYYGTGPSGTTQSRIPQIPQTPPASQQASETPQAPQPPQAPQAPQSSGEDQNWAPPRAQPPSQGGSQGMQGQDQDDDDDVAETQTLEAGRSHLGVMVMGLTPELRRFFGVVSNRGVLIARVEPGSAASRAGIQVGDVLVRVGQTSVSSGDDVIQALAAQQGARTRIVVVRQGRPLRLSAVLPGQQSRTDANQPQDQL